MKAWIPILVLMGLAALLPSWIFGGAALGVAAVLWLRREEEGCKKMRKSPEPPRSSKVVSLHAWRSARGKRP